jgi:hypothetical protein
MLTATERPRRKRLSWESRCEIVAKVWPQGMCAQGAADCSGVRRATAYRRAMGSPRLGVTRRRGRVGRMAAASGRARPRIDPARGVCKGQLRVPVVCSGQVGEPARSSYPTGLLAEIALPSGMPPTGFEPVPPP